MVGHWRHASEQLPKRQRSVDHLGRNQPRYSRRRWPSRTGGGSLAGEPRIPPQVPGAAGLRFIHSRRQGVRAICTRRRMDERIKGSQDSGGGQWDVVCVPCPVEHRMVPWVSQGRQPELHPPRPVPVIRYRIRQSRRIARSGEPNTCDLPAPGAYRLSLEQHRKRLFRRRKRHMGRSPRG